MFRTFLSIAVLSILTLSHPAGAAAQTKTAARSAGKPALTGTVNINTASAGELEGLPGIGAKTASLIVEYRQKNGPFKKVEELMNIRGVGEKNFLKIKPQITVTARVERAAPQGN
jgi:competence protein ComEA